MIEMRLIRLLLISMFLSSCAYIPPALEGEQFIDIHPKSTTDMPDTYLGKPVRWGGVIVEVINNEQETWIEILALPLTDSAKPISDRQESYGRFIAKTNEFLDPEVYQKGLRFTVTGTISNPIDGKVGERPYIYPTVLVDNSYLWPRRTHHKHYVMPGYWYYGYHPYWRFGYPYYGYGVWSLHGHYYPYFPVYGYMSRSFERPHHQYRSGDFSYARQLDWSRRQQLWALQNSRYQVFPGASRPAYRGDPRREDVRNTNPRRPSTANKLRPKMDKPLIRGNQRSRKPFSLPKQSEK